MFGVLGRAKQDGLSRRSSSSIIFHFLPLNVNSDLAENDESQKNSNVAVSINNVR